MAHSVCAPFARQLLKAVECFFPSSVLAGGIHFQTSGGGHEISVTIERRAEWQGNLGSCCPPWPPREFPRDGEVCQPISVVLYLYKDLLNWEPDPRLVEMVSGIGLNRGINRCHSMVCVMQVLLDHHDIPFWPYN